MIDAHVHLRDEEQSQKETIYHGLKVATDSGLCAVFDMPNTARPVTTSKRVMERFNLVEEALSQLRRGIFYGIYIGLTSNPDQIKEAVDAHRWLFPYSQNNRFGVIGLKMFAGESVGDLAIIDTDQQRFVYEQLTKQRYQGVLAVHCEKESEMRKYLWNPFKPETWNLARPEEAEIESVKDQIQFASQSNYQGRLHICHVSSPESVDLVNAARGNLRISCGATPHHLLLNTIFLQPIEGILYKVNPPIRRLASQRELLKRFIKEKIDILETDHAPHTYEEKTGKTTDREGKPVFMSGIPNLASYPDFIQILSERVPRKLLEQLVFDNINKIFGTEIQRPSTQRRVISHLEDYAFDPYKDLK